MKKFFLAFVFLCVSNSSVLATPPRDLQLKYDPQAKSLEIVMKHPTVEPREHYIRTISVTVNNQEPQIHHWGFQRSLSEVKVKLPLELKSGDTVHIKATCSQGGSAEADLAFELSEKKPEK